MSFCRWTIPINQHGSHSTYGLLRQCAFACHTPGKVGNQKILGFSLNEQNGNCACELENSADCTRDTSKSSTIKRYDFREGTLVSNKRLRNEVPTKFINHKPVLDLKLVPRTNGWTRLQTDALLGEESFMPNATSAAEGDNTVMELKVVQDIVRGRTPKIPFGLIWRTSGTAHGRKAAAIYLSKFARAMLLGKKAIKDGQLLRDIAWARSHLRIIDTWLKTNQEPKEWLESYDRIAMRFPVPMQM